MPLSMLETFDAPALTPNCELRNRSTVAPQSLLLMNNDFVLAQAQALAERVDGRGRRRSAAPGAARLATGARPASRRDDEVATPLAFLAAQEQEFAAATAADDKAPLPPPPACRPWPALVPGAAQLERVPVRRLTMDLHVVMDHRRPHDHALLPPPLPRPAVDGHRLAGPGLAAERRTAAAPRRPSRRWRSRRSTCMPKPPPRQPQAKGDDLAVHAGRAEPHRPVRPQAGADEAAPAELPRRHQVRQRRRGQREAVRQPVEVRASTASAAWSCRELLPHLAEVVDDITLVRSMHTGVNNHGQSIYALNTGRIHRRPAGARLAGSPTAWAARAQNLPAYVVLTDPGRPAGARRR